MNYLIDWFQFTIKTDKNAVNPYPVGLETVYNLLGFSDGIIQEFQTMHKGTMYYRETLCYDNISIAIPHEGTEEVMGYMVTMTGNGCRKFEDLYGGKSVCWRSLLTRIRNAVSDGCAVNICRIDFAFDDKTETNNGLLSMSKIQKYADNKQYVSLFRVCDPHKNGDNSDYATPDDESHVMEYSCAMKRKKDVCGHTIYFGNKKSNAFIRFYDKRAERLFKEYNCNIENAPEEFRLIKHWVRMEIVFKRTIAMKICNSMLLLNEKEFSEYLAKVINNYIRFIEPDNVRRERCSVSKWWIKFIGVIETAKLKAMHFKKSDYVSAFRWLERSLAPTLNAVLSRVGEEDFLKMVKLYGAPDRWKSRHKRISNPTSQIYDLNLSNAEIWLSNVPLEIMDGDFYSPYSVGYEVDSVCDNMSLFDKNDNSVPDIPAKLIDWGYDVETEYMLSKISESEWEEVFPE